MAVRQCQMMGWPATSKRGCAGRGRSAGCLQIWEWNQRGERGGEYGTLGTSSDSGRKRVPREAPPTWEACQQCRARCGSSRGSDARPCSSPPSKTSNQQWTDQDHGLGGARQPVRLFAVGDLQRHGGLCVWSRGESGVLKGEGGGWLRRNGGGGVRCLSLDARWAPTRPQIP